MANAFERDLKEGDRIVLIDGRVAVCGGKSFGAQAATAGAALDIRIEGSDSMGIVHSFEDVDAVETYRRFGKENGWEEADGSPRPLVAAEVREVFRRIASGVGKHGEFLRAFGAAVVRADEANFAILLIPAGLLISKYNLRSVLDQPRELWT